MPDPIQPLPIIDPLVIPMTNPIPMKLPLRKIPIIKQKAIRKDPPPLPPILQKGALILGLVLLDDLLPKALLLPFVKLTLVAVLPVLFVQNSLPVPLPMPELAHITRLELLELDAPVVFFSLQKEPFVDLLLHLINKNPI